MRDIFDYFYVAAPICRRLSCIDTATMYIDVMEYGIWCLYLGKICTIGHMDTDDIITSDRIGGLYICTGSGSS